MTHYQNNSTMYKPYKDRFTYEYAISIGKCNIIANLSLYNVVDFNYYIRYIRLRLKHYH